MLLLENFESRLTNRGHNLNLYLFQVFVIIHNLISHIKQNKIIQYQFIPSQNIIFQSETSFELELCEPQFNINKSTKLTDAYKGWRLGFVEEETN